MYLAYIFQSNEDPSELTKTLWRLKVGHRVVTKETGDELWVTDPHAVGAVKQLVELWQTNPSALSSVTLNDPRRGSNPSLFQAFQQSPVSILFLVITAVFGFTTQLGSNMDLVRWFLISPIVSQAGQHFSLPISDVLSSGQIWRLITPTFLHFSLLHIIFNSLWVWDIGRKVERLTGSLLWLVGALIISIVANVLQYTISDSLFFGGLSGLVYGLVGFAWVVPRLIKEWQELIGKALFIFFMVWLGVGFTPLTESIGLGSIANTAHVTGLLSGLILGVVYAQFVKSRQIS